MSKANDLSLRKLQLVTRRNLLGMGGAALGLSALGPTGYGLSLAADAFNPLAPRLPHFAPRAKRMIFVFLHGGPSQVDTFDYKPLLQRDHGKPLPFAKPRVQFAETGNLLASPWRFRQHGESGQWASELFPHIAAQIDKLCFLKSLHGTSEAHGSALLALHTGAVAGVRPSYGSWLLHALGSENADLPGFITLCPTLGHGGVNNWSSAFLPGLYQGAPIGDAAVHARTVHGRERTKLDFAQAMNAEHLCERGQDTDREARLRANELAYRMRTEAPGVLDLASESISTRELYGMDEPATESFGRQCLMARRLSESGVRVVQCTHSYKWDQHGDLRDGHSRNALEVDKPIAGLLTDLEARGLLEDTLVLWGGEFGRTPTAQGTDGRDHNPHGFTMWMAGAGLKRGYSYGETDDYGYYATKDKVHVRDLHATIQHLFGLDPERVTYRHAGRDVRLTDVSGNVVTDVLA